MFNTIIIGDEDPQKLRIKKYNRLVVVILSCAALFAVFQFAATWANYSSMVDRREIHENQTKIERLQKELADAQAENDIMLRARAQIQIILINAASENRPLKLTEIDTIGKLWVKAQYNQVEGIEIVNEK